MYTAISAKLRSGPVVSCACARHTPLSFLHSRAACPTRGPWARLRVTSPPSHFSYIYLPHPTAPAGCSPATVARAPGTSRHPTQFLEAYTLQHRRPAARAHATAHTTVAVLLPDSSLPSLSLSAPPGHRALTETPARDVVEIWPRRRPGARARPLRPLCRESPAVSRGLRPSSRPPRSRRAGNARAGCTPARRRASLCPAPWSGPAPRRPRPGTGIVGGS